MMHTPFPLVLLVFSLLLCSRIKYLLAHDEIGNVNQPPRPSSDGEYVAEPARQDKSGSIEHRSHGEESSDVESNKNKTSATEQLHDESLARSLLHDNTAHSEIPNSIEAQLDSTYHDGELIKPVLNASSVESGNLSIVPQSENVTSGNIATSSGADASQLVTQSEGETSGEIPSSRPDASHQNESGYETVTDLGDDDEADSQKARVFVDYASKHSGANIIDKSKDFQGTSNLLVDDDDRYAISPCDIGNGGTKYVIIALSEDILVKTIKISSYERYSSQTKQFQVLGSQTYPISTKWVDLGTFTAKPWYNTNGQQTFELEQGVWARYLKFRFLTHYGNEHYCTVTQIMVNGQTTLQDFHEVRWDSVEELEEESKNAAGSINVDSDPVLETNSTSEIPILSDDLPVNATHAAIIDSNEDLESTKIPLTQSLETNNSDLEATDVSSDTMENSAISLSIPSSTRSESDSLYTADFYQNILQMSSKSFQTIYEAADNQCIDATALLATSTKSRAFETAFRNVANLTTRLEQSTTTSSMMSTLSSNKSKVYDAVNSAVMSVVKISPISDALKGIQRFLNVDLSHDSMTPRKRVTQPVFDDVTNVTLPNEDYGSFNETFPDSYFVETEKLNTITNEPIDDKEQLSPIELKYETRERKFRLQVAECLGRLNIQELKTKAGKALKGTGATSNVNEPIFKKLADEIKALQTNQGVYDQFIKSATACYQSVITEMLNDMLILESTMENRFTEIERSLLTRNSPHTDSMSWIELIWGILRSLIGFLRNQFSEFRTFYLPSYDDTQGSPWLWDKRPLGHQLDAQKYLLSYVKFTTGFHFDIVSFLVGFILAFLVMFIFIRRKKKLV